MSITLVGLAKAAFGITFTVGTFIVAMDPTVKVAIIVSVPPTISALMWGWVNHSKISTVEVNTNSTLSQLREQIKKLLIEKDLATSRADRAEARTEGDQARETKNKEVL
jgi:uncharacterized membrane protein